MLVLSGGSFLICVSALGYANILVSGHRLVFVIFSKVKRQEILPLHYVRLSVPLSMTYFRRSNRLSVLATSGLSVVSKTTVYQSTQLYFISTTLHAADRSVHYQVHKELTVLF